MSKVGLKLDKDAQKALEEIGKKRMAQILEKAEDLAYSDKIPEIFEVHIEKAEALIDSGKQAKFLPEIVKWFGLTLIGAFLKQVLETINAGNTTIEIPSLLVCVGGVVLVWFSYSNRIPLIALSIRRFFRNLGRERTARENTTQIAALRSLSNAASAKLADPSEQNEGVETLDKDEDSLTGTQ